VGFGARLSCFSPYENERWWGSTFPNLRPSARKTVWPFFPEVSKIRDDALLLASSFTARQCWVRRSGIHRYGRPGTLTGKFKNTGGSSILVSVQWLWLTASLHGHYIPCPFHVANRPYMHALRLFLTAVQHGLPSHPSALPRMRFMSLHTRDVGIAAHHGHAECAPPCTSHAAQSPCTPSYRHARFCPIVSPIIPSFANPITTI